MLWDGEPDRQALERRTDLVNLPRFISGQQAHGRTLVRLDNDPTFGLKLSEGLAHGDRACREVARDHILAQRLAGCEGSLNNRSPQRRCYDARNTRTRRDVSTAQK